jgi:hypothetical protein
MIQLDVQQDYNHQSHQDQEQGLDQGIIFLTPLPSQTQSPAHLTFMA